MTPLARADHAPELLDEPEHDPLELAASLRHVAAVNRWLGGASALLKHLTPFLSPTATIRMLDIGTASADLPRRVVDWARVHARKVEIVAADVHPQMRAIAEHECSSYPEISVQAADALDLPFPSKSFDIATISMTLHHFDGEQQVRVLKELARVSRQAVIVNDLRRTRLNYFGARLMAATVWRGNRLTRHDGPLSVLRAFTPADLIDAARRVDMKPQVFKHFFQRLVLVAVPNDAH